MREQRRRYEHTVDLKQQQVEHLQQLDKRGLDHLHPQEVDARVMMCEGRGSFAYNAQAVVDHEHDLIVALDLCSDENDFTQLEPMLQRVKGVLGAVAEQTVADSGYASGQQLHAVHLAGFPVLVPPKGESDRTLLPKESFAYDAEQDVYVCPRGQSLPLIGHDKSDSRATHDRAVYRCPAADCPERAACTSDKRGRRIKRSPFEDDVERQRQFLAQPALRNLYELRKEIVEHVFGCIKSNAGLRRFTVRGLKKALAQWALACLAFDLRKLHQVWMAGHFHWEGKAARS